MRKIVKPPKVCSHCGTQLIAPTEVAFCDWCKEKYKDEKSNIEITVFWKVDNDHHRAQRQEFCSAICARNWLLNFPWNKKRVEFFSLPLFQSYKEISEFLGNEGE